MSPTEFEYRVADPLVVAMVAVAWRVVPSEDGVDTVAISKDL